MSKLTDAQRKVLAFYDNHGWTTDSYGRMSTWNALVRMGFLARSRGLGVIETCITDAGRAALQNKDESR